MKKTKMELFVNRKGFNNMFADSNGLDYQGMTALSKGDRLKIFFGGAWHNGTFIAHEATNVSKICFDSRKTKSKKRYTFVPNGLSFDEKTFDRICAGSHFKKLEGARSK